MKSLLFILTMAALPTAAFTQTKEATIEVMGVCDDCKNRIEEAAFGKGVKFAEWNKTTKMLTVAYKADKTNVSEIEARVAKAGHRTANFKVADADYKALPACCQYDHTHDH